MKLTSVTAGRSMGKVLWHVTMSLDGFIAGPDDAMEWAFEYPEPSATVEEIIETTGALAAALVALLLRRSGDRLT